VAGIFSYWTSYTVSRSSSSSSSSSKHIIKQYTMFHQNSPPPPPYLSYPPFCIGVYLPKEADSTGLVSLDKYVFRFMRSSTNKRDTIILMEKNNVVKGGGGK
jgi:hypothetical protein